jgi:hypothetical protein
MKKLIPIVICTLGAFVCFFLLQGNLHAGKPRLEGIWMGYLNYNTDSPRWIRFYDNGEIYWDMPSGGFTGFRREASKVDTYQKEHWGTYTMKAVAGEIRKPRVNNPWKITFLSNDKIKIDNDTYYRCTSINNVKLNGSWSTYGGADESFIKSMKDPKALIIFSSDGRFIDHGIFSASFLSKNDLVADAPGEGSYETKDFSLILHYADGRVRQLAFSYSVNAKQAGTIIYLDRASLFKRKD